MDITILESQISNLNCNTRALALAKNYGLDILHVSWDDCSRFKGSSLGDCISDCTLRVNNTCQPIIRRPNFQDITCDLPISQFFAYIGNEKGNTLQQIPFQNYLENIGTYTGNRNLESLFLPRDKNILVSTQVSILPLRDNKTDFDIKLFNYQYDRDDPAVLAIIVSEQGTSAQVITEYNQTLVFNKAGYCANFRAQRLADYRKETNSDNTGDLTAAEKEKNILFIYQIPLKQTAKPAYQPWFTKGVTLECAMTRGSAWSRGFDQAILSTSDASNKQFYGTGNLKLVRNPDFPIRCTIQYYGVTDTIDLDESIFRSFSEQLNKTYNSAPAKGSLVTEKTDRITETKNNKNNPGWINNF